MVDLPESFDSERYHVLVDQNGELRAGAQVAHPLRFRIERIPAWLECLVDLARNVGRVDLSDRCFDVCLFHHLLAPLLYASAHTDARRLRGVAGHHLRTLLASLKVEHGGSGFGGVLIDPACRIFGLLVHSSWLLRMLHAFGLPGRHAIGMWSIGLEPSLDEELNDLSRPLFSSPLDSQPAKTGGGCDPRTISGLLVHSVSKRGGQPVTQHPPGSMENLFIKPERASNQQTAFDPRRFVAQPAPVVAQLPDERNPKRRNGKVTPEYQLPLQSAPSTISGEFPKPVRSIGHG